MKIMDKKELEMNFLFSTNMMERDNVSMPMLGPELFDQDNLDELVTGFQGKIMLCVSRL